MAAADDDTDTQTQAPPAAVSPDMLSQAMQLAKQFMPQPVQQDTTPVSRSWTSLLGEALGGGPPVSGMTDTDRELAGHQALMQFGSGLMAASRYQPGQTLFSNLAGGLQGAQRGEIGAEEMAMSRLGAQQEYAQQQAQNRLEALKTALPLLTLQTQMQQAAAARNLAGGGGAPPAPNVAQGGSIAGNTYEAAIGGHEGLGPDPRLPTTVGGFIPSTWQAFAAANPDLFKGMSPDQVAAARSDPKLNAAGITWLAQQNAGELTKNGVTPSGPSLGIAHYLGAVPAAKVMAAPDNTPVSSFVSDAAVKANPELATLTVGQLKQRYANVPAPGFLTPTKTASGAPAPTTAATPPAASTAPPGGGFGMSAFNAPARTVMPAPASQADAPNTTDTVPPVPTPQMAAARALAVKAGRPMPIAGTDGLFANPDGSVGPGPGGGGLGRRADISPIVQGMQTAQTTMPPSSVVGAGPAAGGGTAPTVSPLAPASAFGGGAFTTAPALTVGAPAPQVTTPAPQVTTPAATVTPPAPPQPYPDIKAGDGLIRHPGSFADFYASQHVPPPQTEDFNPNLTPAQQAAFNLRRQQISTLPFAEQPKAFADLTAAIQDTTQGKSQAAAAATTKYEDAQRAAIQTRYDNATTAYNTAAQAQLAAKNKMQENEQTSNLASKQKVLEGLDTEATSAHENLAQLQLVKQLSDAAGQPGILASYPELRSWLVKTGIATDDQAQQWSAQQALDAASNKLTLAARAGSGMSRMTNMDLQFLQHTSPQSFNPQDWRNAQIGYLTTLYQRQQQFAGLVHRGVADNMSLTDAQNAADAELGPTIKTMPTANKDGTSMTKTDQAKWNFDNLTPNSFYKDPTGRLRIFAPGDATRPE